MKHTFNILVVACGILFLAACSMLSERSASSASRGNVEFTRTLTAGPLPAVTVSNNVVRVGAPVETETITSTALQNFNADAKSTLPLGTKLILIGVGLLLLITSGAIVLRSSAAARAAFNVTDASVAEAIRRLRSKSSLSTDPTRTAEINVEIAELESLRGRIKR